MSVCPYCGANNEPSVVFCNSCGHELGTTSPAPLTFGGETGSRYCVSCGRAIQWNANVCPYCGHDYRYPAGSGIAQETVSSGMKVLVYILSFLIPIVGFVLGIVYITRPDPDPKHVGKMCLILAVISIALSIFSVVALVAFLQP